VSRTRADLFAFLDGLGIAYETIEHPPIFTVDEGRALKATMPGGHSKNLFVKDKRGDYFLIVVHADCRADLVGLGKALGAKGRLSFGKPDAMAERLGVTPGSVTPFGLINAQPGDGQAPAFKSIILDTGLLAFDRVWFHPLENTASTAIAREDLVRFITACGYAPQQIDCANPGA